MNRREIVTIRANCTRPAIWAQAVRDYVSNDLSDYLEEDEVDGDTLTLVFETKRMGGETRDDLSEMIAKRVHEIVEAELSKISLSVKPTVAVTM